MNRSLQSFFVLLFALVLAGCVSKHTPNNTSSGTKERPNVVIIMADDLDSKQLSVYGGRNLKTVHIDRLAEQGLKFNNMVASEAMCVPLRTSLFTGLYPMRHGSYQNHKPVYNDNMKSIVHYLGDLGYEVALTGKDHVTKPVSVFPFIRVEGFEPNCVSPTDVYQLNDVKKFITNRDKPYCLFIMSNNPHAPWTVGDPSEFDADKLILPPHWVDTRQTREQFTKYLAEVRRLDNQVGELMQLIKETGQEDNTIFIFLGEQGAQFPGAKWTLWDEGQHSSMIIRWPGMVKANTQTDAIVQYEDILPTLVEMAGGRAIQGLEGVSFLNVVTGRSQNARDFAYGIHNNIPEGPAYPIRAIRGGQYKLLLNLLPENKYAIRYLTNRKNVKYWDSWFVKAQNSPRDQFLLNRITTRPAVEFYDLKADPYELNNLANDPKYSKLIEEYQTKLYAWMKQQGDPGAAADVPLKKDSRK